MKTFIRSVFFFIVVSAMSVNAAAADASWVWRQAIPGEPTGTDFSHISASSELVKIYAGGFNTYIHNSFDRGESWATKTAPGCWSWISSSGDGTRAVAVEQFKGLYVTGDSGDTFTPVSIDGQESAQWAQAIYTGDGKKIIAAQENGPPFYSLDGGQEWTQVPLPVDDGQLWRSFASDYTGLYSIAADVGSQAVYLSKDDGASWAEVLQLAHKAQEPAEKILCAGYGSGSTKEADTPKFIVARSPGKIYISTSFGENGPDWREEDPAQGDVRWIDIDFQTNSHIMEMFIAALTEDSLYVFTNDNGWRKAALPEGETPGSVRISEAGDALLLGTRQGIYLSHDFGASWRRLQTGAYWRSVAVSGDGLSLYAAGEKEALFRSVDGGSEWGAPLGSDDVWDRVAVSRDGKSVLASTGAHKTDLKFSVDGGNTWNVAEGFSQAQTWMGLAAADGGKLFAACGRIDDGDGYVYVSRDGGAHWEQTSLPAERWRVVSWAADGSLLVALHDMGDAFLSRDRGATWRKMIPADEIKTWYGAAVSRDGSRIYLAAFGDDLYRSLDGGETWSRMSPGDKAREWTAVSCSEDGKTVVASCLDGPLYVSLDEGSAWTPMGAEGDAAAMWSSVAVSSDGKKVAASMYSGNVWIGERFDSLATLSVAPSPTFGGTISPYGVILQSKGYSTDLAAEPAEGYVFGGWTLAGRGSLGGQTVACNGDCAVTALFSLGKVIDPGKVLARLNDSAPSGSVVSVKDAELPALPGGFNPSGGNDGPLVSVRFGDSVFSCSNGVWKEEQDGVFVFESWKKVLPKVHLVLDSKKGLWSFDAKSPSLNVSLTEALPLVLTLDAYRAYAARLEPTAAISWRHKKKRAKEAGFAVNNLSGEYSPGKNRKQMRISAAALDSQPLGFGNVDLKVGAMSVEIPAESFETIGRRRIFEGDLPVGRASMSLDLDSLQWRFFLQNAAGEEFVPVGNTLEVSLKIGENPEATTSLSILRNGALSQP